MGFHFTTGVDEAGYGPLLGPLVVGLATIRSEVEISPAEPWKVLAPIVTKKRSKHSVAVADSKALHRSKKGDVSGLELGVLAFIALERGEAPKTFRELVDHLTGGQSDYLDDYPWYRGRDLELPVQVDPLEFSGRVRKLRRAAERAGITVEEIRARPLDVVDFNRGVAATNSKGEVNARAIGDFLSTVWNTPDRERSRVISDRLGGRTRYGPFLYELFPDGKLDIEKQDEIEQRYSIHGREDDRLLEITFRKESEDTSFPTALASMVAKYTRELHMRLFNTWWQEHTKPDLAGTAGYYQDARRFLSEIEPWIEELGVSRGILMRKR